MVHCLQTSLKSRRRNNTSQDVAQKDGGSGESSTHICLRTYFNPWKHIQIFLFTQVQFHFQSSDGLRGIVYACPHVNSKESRKAKISRNIGDLDTRACVNCLFIRRICILLYFKDFFDLTTATLKLNM